MNIVRILTAVLLCFVIPTSVFATDAGYKVVYYGGSLPDQKAGTAMQLVINGDHITLLKDKTEVANIPTSAVTEISYGQDVHRRIGAAIGLAVISLGICGTYGLNANQRNTTWD